MRARDETTLWRRLTRAGSLHGRSLLGANSTVQLDDLVRGSSLGGRLSELRDRSVLIATADQLTFLLAAIELDGVARRMILCPPGLSGEELRFVAATAAVDAVVSDAAGPDVGELGLGSPVLCSPVLGAPTERPEEVCPTEWILLTSGTTGLPKLVVHGLESLTGAIAPAGPLAEARVWSTFYDIRRYGGLQIALRALLGGGSLVLSGVDEPTAEFLARAGAHGVTHMSGTPSHWRRALMNPNARCLSPSYVRLSGEVADQGILDRLAAFFPQAKVAHAFASTEAGVAFEVGDGLAGFPASLVGQTGGAVQLKIIDGSLRIRSPRTASLYLGADNGVVADPDGYVDTGDMIEVRDGRCFFVGRRGGVVNVGGAKVHPEEVEAVINRHPAVHHSLVKARKSPITGALVTAEVVLADGAKPAEPDRVKAEILALCREGLAAHKVPALIRLVPSLEVAASGKLARPRA